MHLKIICYMSIIPQFKKKDFALSLTTYPMQISPHNTHKHPLFGNYSSTSLSCSYKYRYAKNARS